MSLELVGIHNTGEFYSQHYLDSLFASDLKELQQRWAEAEKQGGEKAPAKRLAVLANAYFKAAARAAGEHDRVARLEAARGLHAALLEALGYQRDPQLGALEDGRVVPLLLAERHHGRPWLWVVEAPFAVAESDSSPLDEAPLREQLPSELVEDASIELFADSWRELLDRVLFRQPEPPRFVLMLAGADVFLVDRDKWAQGKHLRFALGELFGRRESKAMAAVAGLLHRDVVMPAGGPSLLERLDENSHKHAYAVSTALKQSVQEAIELLANEALHYRRNVSKAKVFDDDQLAYDLTQDCITYLYRLLFLFYVEARGQELGIVPMGADSYRLGYSLETLRGLEQVPLTSVEAREGYFLHESLARLFRIVQHGYPRHRQLELAGGEDAPSDSFTVQPLRSQLFDDGRLRVLGSARLRNDALQAILRLLSLSREGKGQRGRISYAQLGINQLGAVYEGLLSYRGFFAQEDVIEIAGSGAGEKEVSQTYFIAASRRDELNDDLLVTDRHGRIKVHSKGTYLFRMAGRDREKSASYYTPEVLTECLVRYTLKERLGEPGSEGALRADEILQLSVCEPAMGSGAFLNEAIEQLASAYLARKQAERLTEAGTRSYENDEARVLAEREATLDSDRALIEKQKVKAHFALHNCYGVDSNPLAAELGKVSLWLGTLYPGALAPYLDLRIQVGNSLIGARRAVFAAAELTRKPSKTSGATNWLSQESTAVPLGRARPAEGVYHFLLPDAGMAPFDDDKVLKELEPAGVAELKAWRKQFCAPFDGIEVQRLLVLSARIDELWQDHLQMRKAMVERTRRPITLWGQPAVESAPRPGDAQTLEEEVATIARTAPAAERLQRVMDYWCALWFWPLSEAGRLPSRAQWLADLESLLAWGNEGERPADAARMAVVERVRARHRFFHWELAFAEVFAERGGMDVILGNPPWRKVEWSEGDVLADFDPMLAVGKLSAKQWADRRAGLLEKDTARGVYVGEAEEAAGTQAFLNAMQSYPLLAGQKANLYKCFMTRAWALGGACGAVGLLQQPGVFDDPKGGRLRSELAARAVLVARFKNSLMLFEDVHDLTQFCTVVAVARSRSRVAFPLCTNLIHPGTLDESFAHDGLGPVPGLRTGEGKWDLRGHRSRLVPIDEEALTLFARLYDAPGTPALEARLPVVHSREILEVLRRFASAPRRLSDLGDAFFCTQHFNETLQQQDGTIRRETRYPKNADEWIVSGPHFYVGTPFNKTPNEGCKHNQDYSVVDLTQIPDNYLPRTNYVPACSPAEYRDRTPMWQGKPAIDFFRHVHREMVAPTNERTLVPALLPLGAAHVNTLLAISCRSLSDTLGYSALAASIPVDFFIKSTGMGHVNIRLASQLPLPIPGPVRDALIRRVLRLNCLTTHYAPLWQERFDASFLKDTPTTGDARAGSYVALAPTWQRDTPLRTPFSRRQALCEIDALAALSLGMTLDELLLIYRVQFPVMQQYERETFYDRRGKIVFTVSKGLTGVGVRERWKEALPNGRPFRDAQPCDTLPDWARDEGGPYEPPFDCPDREVDMAQAYRAFQQRYGLHDEGER